MDIPAGFEQLTGEWRGTNRLWHGWLPDESAKESESTATVSFEAKENFLSIRYRWAFEGENQEGLLVLGCEKDSLTVNAFWIDSWHMSENFMHCTGRVENNGILSIKGFYAVPEHPDWGWRTVIETENEDSFKFVMYNVSPEGKEDLAVESVYSRAIS